MAELTQEQLLLLNNLMYYDAPKDAVTVADIANYAKHNTNTAKLSGGFEKHPDQMVEIADAILSDEKLSSLRVVGSTNKNNVSAKCFVDPDTHEATIAIRGTGGSYDAWKDNVVGGYETDTECQKTIDSFVKEMGNKYDDITITGHSKGGNLAQYATVKNGDEIDRCVSFDGQGFNKDFIEANKDAIEANKDKIVSVNAYNDYVNILLHPIAGKTVYLHNDKDGLYAHSAYTLWTSNRGKLDERGDYYPPVEQSDFVKNLKHLLDTLTDDIDDMPDYVQKQIYALLGSIAGVGFDRDLSQAEIDDLIKTLSQSISVIAMYEYLQHAYGYNDIARLYNLIKTLIRFLDKQRNQTGKTNTGKTGGTSGSSGNHQFTVRPARLQDISNEMAGIQKKLAGISADIETIDYTESKEVNQALRKITSHMENTNKDILTMMKALKGSAKLYRNCEKAITAGRA